MFIRSAAAFLLAASAGITSTVATASPLDIGSWFQIARLANGDAGMFDGNGELRSDYSFGTYSSPSQVNDFERPFTTYTGMTILFITGDGTTWGTTSYSSLRALIDARAGDFNPNIAFTASINGGPQITTTGNVLSRDGFTEDPWISLQGTHFDGVGSNLIIWGETDYSGPHANLEQAHGGINVFVSLASPVPGPIVGAGLPGIVMALGGLIAWRRRRMVAA